MPVNETSGEGARGFTYTVAITRRSNQPTEDAETASYDEPSESWTVSAATAEAIRSLIEQAAGGDEPTWDPQLDFGHSGGVAEGIGDALAEGWREFRGLS